MGSNKLSICILMAFLLFTVPAMGADYREALRSETVIFDNGGGPVANPENWNPYVKDRRLDQGFHQAVMEPLFILNYETGSIIPWLAESYEADKSGKQWTINLRQGIKWSDGENMNADDLVFTINLLKNNPQLLYAGEIIRWVKSVTKIDELTVRFDLTEANPRFILDHFSVKIWGRINILPEHIWQDKDPLVFNNYDSEKGWPVFTGPYKVADISQIRFVYTRDDNWWGANVGFKPLPNPKKLVWVALGGKETRIAAMAIDELDSLLDISVEEFLSLQEINPRISAYHKKLPYSWPDPCVRNIEINNSAPPWNDKDMRWALNFAIDREEVVSLAYQGSTIPAKHFFPAYSILNGYVEILKNAGLYNKYPLLTFDPVRSREIFKSKGYILNRKTGYFEKAGQELSLHIQTPEPLIEKQLLAQVVVKQIQQVGINATWGNVPYASFWEKFFSGDYQARVGWQACGSVNEPWSSLNSFNIRWYKPIGEQISSADANGWRWKNQAYSNLVDQIGKLPMNDSGIPALIVQAMDLWLDELPIIPVAQAKKIVPFNHTYWTNWPSADNPYIQPTSWWQSSHVIIHNIKPSGAKLNNEFRLLDEKISINTALVSPFIYVDKGELKGQSTKVVQTLLKRLEVKSKINIYPWARAYHLALKQKNTLIYLIERLPENEQLFKWVGTITPIDTHVYRLKTRSDIQINKLEDLKSYKVGVVRKSGAHRYLKMRGIKTLEDVVSIGQNIKKLAAGRIDVLIAAKSSFISQVESLGLSAQDFSEAYPVTELSIDGYLAFSKNTSEAIVNHFRMALARLKASGEWDKINASIEVH